MNNIVLQKTWVQGRPVVVDNLLGTAFTGEAGAHTFKIRGVDAAQETVTISGTITGKLLAANNVTISLSGSIEDGCAVVTLTDECYDVPGRFIFSVYATSGDTTLCLYCAVGNIMRTDSQVIAYPTESLPNITSLMADLEQILADWPADYSQLQSDVSSLKSVLSAEIGRNTDGYLALVKGLFEQGDYSDGTKVNTSRAIRYPEPINIFSGDTIKTKASNILYLGWQLIDGNGDIVETGYEYTIYKVKMTTAEHTFTHDGKLYIAVANGYNQGNSTAISPSDFEDGKIEIYNEYAWRIGKHVTQLQSDLNYTNKNILEGGTLLAKGMFYQFNERNIVMTNPIYVVEGNALITKQSALYMNWYITDDSDNILEGQGEYSQKIMIPAQSYVFSHSGWFHINIANGYNWGNSSGISVNDMTAYIKVLNNHAEVLAENLYTDIVSLNHDTKEKVLNGEKPFDRATTVPLALLHFSDIHAAQTNLKRIVDMANHLGTDIDDVICTGDMVENNYSTTCMDYWNAVNGAENILLVVGNHDLADGEHGYSSDQIGQATAYAKYFSPYISNWGVTMAGTDLTYWYKDYSAKKVRLIGLNYLLEGDASSAQKTWLVQRLSEAKTAGYTVVIAEHSPLNSFTEIPCNFNIIGKPWGYTEIKADIQSAVQDFIDNGGEFACYIAGHSHNDYVGYNSNYPNQLCIVVTTAQTTGFDNDQRRVNGEKSQDAANVVLVDTVTKTVKLVRIGADMDTYLRGRNLFSIKYTDKTITAQS